MSGNSASDTLPFHLAEVPETDMQQEISAFLIDAQSRRLSPRTVELYQSELGYLADYLEESARIRKVVDVDARHLRAYLLHLEERGRNVGGQHVAYRVCKTFLRWYEREHEPNGWRNPIKRVRAPKLPDAPLDPVSLEDVRAMLATCRPRTLWGDRGRAIIMCLLDTGCRASEFCSLNIDDVNMHSGAVVVRKGKGGKKRVTFLGAKARQALARYLRRYRRDARPHDPLWTNKNGRRMTYSGLKSLMRRRAKAAGIRYPGLHSFRRAFTVLSYRQGANVLELRDLLGHSDLSVLRRYLKLSEDDLQKAHERTGPVDNLL